MSSLQLGGGATVQRSSEGGPLMTALRRSNFVFPHPNPVARLSLAVHAMDALDDLAVTEEEDQS
jgi:hypothetical protein